MKTLLASAIMMALTPLQSPAQVAPAPTPYAVPNQITVNVLGEVNKPARIILPRGANILDAIAAAGGLTNTANPRQALVIHKGEGDKPETMKIDLGRILDGLANAVPLRDGDTVMFQEKLFKL